MKKRIFLLLFLLPWLNPSFGQQAPSAAVYSNLEDGLALEGYDPVSYHTGHPAQGKREFSLVLDGVEYRFTNAGNRSRFREDPERYMPEFGGWCAYAMGKSGDLVAVDPETFKIVDGKLYLFYNAYLNNTLKKWNKDEAGYLQRSHANWNKKLKSWNDE